MTALSKFARSAFRMPPTTTATRVLGIHAADGPGRRRTTTIFRRKTVLQRAFCSALRTATAELQTSLHTPDAVFLEDEVMKLKAKGDHHAEKNASETMESKAVSTEAKQKIYDMAALLAALDDACAPAEQVKDSATNKKSKVPRPEERFTSFKAFVRSAVERKLESAPRLTVVGKAWAAALESSQFQPSGVPLKPLKQKQSVAVIYLVDGAGAGAGETDESGINRKNEDEVFAKAAVRLLEGYGKVVVVGEKESLERTFAGVGAADGDGGGDERLMLVEVERGVRGQDQDHNADACFLRLLADYATVFDHSPDDQEAQRFRAEAVTEGKNWRLLLHATPVGGASSSISSSSGPSPSPQSVFPGLKQRDFVEWQDKKEDFYRYELSDRADELLSLLPVNGQQRFHDLLSTFFELVRGEVGTSNLYATSTTSSTTTRLLTQFRPNVHVFLPSFSAEIPDSVVKLAVFADACPPAMCGDGPAFTLHVLKQNQQDLRKDPVRGFLRMLRKRPDVWRIVEDCEKMDAAIISDSIGQQTTTKEMLVEMREQSQLFLLPAHSYVHLLPQSFQAKLATAAPSARVLVGFPEDGLSLFKHLTRTTTGAAGEATSTATTPLSDCFELPPCDLVRASEVRDEFEDFPDDPMYGDERQMRDLGIEDDFDEGDEELEEQDDEELAGAEEEEEVEQNADDSEHNVVEKSAGRALKADGHLDAQQQAFQSGQPQAGQRGTRRTAESNPEREGGELCLSQGRTAQEDVQHVVREETTSTTQEAAPGAEAVAHAEAAQSAGSCGSGVDEKQEQQQAAKARAS